MAGPARLLTRVLRESVANKGPTLDPKELARPGSDFANEGIRAGILTLAPPGVLAGYPGVGLVSIPGRWFGQLPDHGDLFGDVVEFAVGVVAAGSQEVEGAFAGDFLAGHENADGYPDLTVGRQGDLQLLGGVVRLGQAPAVPLSQLMVCSQS